MRSFSHRSLPAEEPASRQHSVLLADGAGAEGQVASAAQQQQRAAAQQQAEPAPTAAPAAAAASDEYVYKDPQGVVQGPFARQDIIDW
jgi:hypothetical protein